MELTKAWRSIFDQVDWSEVMREAGGQTTPKTYQTFFKTIVNFYINELLKGGGCRKDTKFENDSNENYDMDNLQQFLKNESECESENYVYSGEVSDEEDSDGENSD